MATALIEMAKGSRPDALDSPELLAAEAGSAFHRYNGILDTYVPWLLRLQGRSGRVYEIGCGSGSSTAAFAHACETIVGFDVDAHEVEVARRRFALLGLNNAEARALRSTDVSEPFEGAPRLDGVIFYATLDVLGPAARRAALSAAWAAIKPGGFLLIGETRGAAYAREALDSDTRDVGPEDFIEGLGANFTDWLVSTPLDPEIVQAFGDTTAEREAVRQAAAQRGYDLADDLAAPLLSLLFVKPGRRRPHQTKATQAQKPAGSTGSPRLEDVRSWARDPANFDEFAALMGEVLPQHVYLDWTDDAAYKRHFAAWQKAGFTVLPNHYYSPVPDLNTLSYQTQAARYPLHGIDLNETAHRDLLRSFLPFVDEIRRFSARRQPTTDGLWFAGGAFGLLDAQAAYAMVRSQKPKRIIEIGTGFSTLAMAEACARNGAEGYPVDFTTIDPYPSFAVDLNPAGLTRNLTTPVERLPLETFDALEAGDILFIDSTHVIRPGGDVEFEYFHILPRLKSGVWIHVHDIFFPLPYPPEWARDRHIFWNEQQLLMAFLAFNQSFQARLALSAACDQWIDAISEAFPGTTRTHGPGSFWMQRVS